MIGSDLPFFIPSRLDGFVYLFPKPTPQDPGSGTREGVAGAAEVGGSGVGPRRSPRLRSCDLQGRRPAGRAPGQLGLWSLGPEDWLSLPQPWVATMKPGFTSLESEVQPVIISSDFRPLKFGIRTPSPSPAPRPQPSVCWQFRASQFLLPREGKLTLSRKRPVPATHAAVRWWSCPCGARLPALRLRSRVPARGGEAHRPRHLVGTRYRRGLRNVGRNPCDPRFLDSALPSGPLCL